MTWKRCGGCTRAISATAFTCEYCGQVCDDVMDFLPTEDRNSAPAAEDHDPGLGVADALAAFETSERRDDEYRRSDSDDNRLYLRPEPAGVFEQSEYPDPEQEPIVGETAAHGLPPLEIVFDAPFAATGSSGAATVDDPTDNHLHAESTAAPAAGTEQRPVPAARRISPRQIAIAGGGVLAAGVLILITMGVRGSTSPTAPVATTPARRAPAAAPASRKAAGTTAKPAVEPPHWTRVMDGRWLGTSRHSVAFEVSATSRIHVWTRDVTPVLVVRCDAGRTEAFVYTQSAARMEPQDGDHTVTIGFDEGRTTTERWPDSAEHDALFARNGTDLTRQLAAARTFRFGFTPHNAEPTLATFAVDGLSPLMASAGRQCESRKPGNR